MALSTKNRRATANPLAKVTAERLEELRRNHSLTVQQFADRCRREPGVGVGHSMIVAWRNGRSVPGGAYLRHIAETFGVTTDWILGIQNAPKYPVPISGTAAEQHQTDAKRLVRQKLKFLMDDYYGDLRWNDAVSLRSVQIYVGGNDDLLEGNSPERGSDDGNV